jgi:hypothetical protein
MCLSHGRHTHVYELRILVIVIKPIIIFLHRYYITVADTTFKVWKVKKNLSVVRKVKEQWMNVQNCMLEQM